ncbi:MAG TPA: hypothetical protein VNT27_05040, partial [Propionibacteriaceae bacterium]|nr:hypothetical protein [Propionibacteriaceae bacterium]
AKPGRAWTRVRTQVDQLLSADGPHPAMTVHAENARQAAPCARWAQQPCGRGGPVANRPAESGDQDAAKAVTTLVEHGRKVAGLSQAEHAAQRRTRRVHADVGLT